MEGKKDFSVDQNYLLYMCNDALNGNCSHDFSLRNPEKLALSKWLKLANHLLRLCMATENPV